MDIDTCDKIHPEFHLVRDEIIRLPDYPENANFKLIYPLFGHRKRIKQLFDWYDRYFVGFLRSPHGHTYRLKENISTLSQSGGGDEKNRRDSLYEFHVGNTTYQVKITYFDTYDEDTN